MRSAEQVAAIDCRLTAILELDRELTWKAGDPVTYSYQGTAPDVGAIERE